MDVGIGKPTRRLGQSRIVLYEIQDDTVRNFRFVSIPPTHPTRENGTPSGNLKRWLGVDRLSGQDRRRRPSSSLAVDRAWMIYRALRRELPGSVWWVYFVGAGQSVNIPSGQVRSVPGKLMEFRILRNWSLILMRLCLCLCQSAARHHNHSYRYALL